MYKSRHRNHRQRSLFWKPINPRALSSSPADESASASTVPAEALQPRQRVAAPSEGQAQASLPSHASRRSAASPVAVASAAQQRHAAGSVAQHVLTNQAENVALRSYETRIKNGFDTIEAFVNTLSSGAHQANFEAWAQDTARSKLGYTLPTDLLRGAFDSKAIYAHCFFKQFMALSEEFFNTDPLHGQQVQAAEERFRQAGFHAVGIAPCADGRLAHVVSYILRLPYALARRKSHAGALFDVSESVRNWVFVEHRRFREGRPNPANEPTQYLKIAAYHFSQFDPLHQGCAAHGSDEAKAAAAAKAKLSAFRQGIENRFGCGSTVQTLLIGVNTDDDSLKIYVPNENGEVCLKCYLETKALYQQTASMTADEARATLHTAIDQLKLKAGSTPPQASMRELLAWFIENNFSQIEYVNTYENGRYADIGHAERFIGIGHGFEEVQLRNLTYYSFLETIEEGANDIDVGIKIFKQLNVKTGLPIPIVIRSDYDGKVPGSKVRAAEKAKRIEKALHDRYPELSREGWVVSMCTLRDYTAFKAAERLEQDAQGV